MINRIKIVKAFEDNDRDAIKDELMVLFEEKLERKIWKIYKALEYDLTMNESINEQDESQ